MIKRLLESMKQKKIAKIKAKQQESFKTAMNNVYRTLKWIEKQLPNRKSRKQFYSDVLNKGFIHSYYLDMFMGKFIDKDEVCISRKEYNELRIIAGSQKVKI